MDGISSSNIFTKLIRPVRLITQRECRGKQAEVASQWASLLANTFGVGSIDLLDVVI